MTDTFNVNQTPFEVKQRLLADYHDWKSDIAKGNVVPGIASLAAQHAHRLLAFPLRWCTSADEIRDIIQTELHDEYALAFSRDSVTSLDGMPRNHGGGLLEFDDAHHYEHEREQGCEEDTGNTPCASTPESFPIEPGPDPYVALIKRLLLRADYVGANEVLAEMSEHGIPTDDAQKALEIRADTLSLSKLRTAHMSKWCVRGHKNSEACRKYVLDMLDKLVQCGEADVHQFNVAMHFCDTSEEIRDLIRGPMARLEVAPTISIYKKLFRMLMREGNFEEAWDMVEEDLPVSNSKGEEDDDRKSFLARMEDDDNRKRFLAWTQQSKKTSKRETLNRLRRVQWKCLMNHIHEGTPEAWQRANHFYELVMKPCLTARSSVTQNIMLTWCSSSQEMEEWLRVESAAKSHLSVVETVVKQMVLEGDVEGAHHYIKTLDHDLERKGGKIKSHLLFWKNMNKLIQDEKELDQKRLIYVTKCIERGTLLDEAKVRTIFEIWRKNGEILEVSEEVEKLESSVSF